MTIFVGAEYIIALMLIEKAKIGEQKNSLSEFNNYSISVQKKANEQKIDVVFLTSKSQLFSAIYNFSDYFTCKFDEDGQLKNIMIENTKDILDLEYHFIGFLSSTVLDIMFETVKDIV